MIAASGFSRTIYRVIALFIASHSLMPYADHMLEPTDFIYIFPDLACQLHGHHHEFDNFITGPDQDGERFSIIVDREANALARAERRVLQAIDTFDQPVIFNLQFIDLDIE